MEEIKDLSKVAKATLLEVERNGWTVRVHTNCLAILKKLALTGEDKVNNE